MSNDDYKMGQQGLRYDRTMNKEDYDRGKADREDRAAMAGYGKTDVSGAGIGLLFMLPILAIMYPIVTLSLSSMMGLLWLATRWMPPSVDWIRLAISIAGIVAAFVYAIKAEARASESKIYRNVRHVFRTLAIGAAIFALMIDLRHAPNFQSALDHAPPSSVAVALLVMGLMLWLGPGFDRFFFPVRDARAIRLEKKYAGMSGLEIDETKHKDFRARARFAVAWLGSSIVAMALLPHVPVVLTAAGCFVACLILRKALFSRKQEAWSKTS